MAVKGFRLHPGSWWLLSFALIAFATSASLDALIPLVILLAAPGLLISESSPLAAPAKLYVFVALAMVVTRIIFRVVFNYQTASFQPAFEIPQVDLNLGALGEVSLFGLVSWVTLKSAATEGLRLAAIVLSVGLASTLANPKRLLKSLPGSLREVSAAITIAVNFAPQIVRSFERVKKSRALRGRTKKHRALSGLIIPVLEDALEQSVRLAAAMDSRGFGARTPSSVFITATLRALGVAAILLFGSASFLLLTNGKASAFALMLLAMGSACAVLNISISRTADKRTNISKQKLGFPDAVLAMISAVLISSSIGGWFE